MNVTPKKLAVRLLKKYRNVQEILQAYQVIFIDYMPLMDTKGFYQYAQRCHFVYINRDINPAEKNFVICHEIGHMLMHRNQNAIFWDSRAVSPLNIFECQANTFAVEYNLPDSYLHEYRDYSVYDLARIRGVPEEFVSLKRVD